MHVFYLNFNIFAFPPPPICSVSIIVIGINHICRTQSLIIIMANTNRRNPNAPEPTRPTASSPSLRRTRYVKGGKCKDPPESLPLPRQSTVQKGTDSNTQRKDLSKDLHNEDSLIEESKKRFEEVKQRCLLELDALAKQRCQLESPPPSVARGGDTHSPDESPIEATPDSPIGCRQIRLY